MTDSDKSESKPDCSEELTSLDNLKAKLEHLEATRGRQNAVKTVGLLAIAGLFFYICFSLYSSYNNFDKEEFSAAMNKELENTFKPRIQNLSKKSETELLPLIKATVTDVVNKKLPEIKERIDHIGEKAQESMKKKLADSLHAMLEEIENDLKAEIGDESFEFIFDNSEFEEMVADEVYRQIESSEGIVEDFRAEIEYLKNENPEIMKVEPEKAERVFLTSLLDLMKYDIDPELGKTMVKEVK